LFSKLHFPGNLSIPLPSWKDGAGRTLIFQDFHTELYAGKELTAMQ